MALVVSAETARAQIASLAQQAEGCKTSFARFVAEKPASSLSRGDRLQRIQEIQASYRTFATPLLQIKKQFKTIKTAHQHLPEWNGIGDRNDLSTLFTGNLQRAWKCFIEMMKINTKANEEFRKFLPHDFAPLIAESVPSF